MVSDPDPASDYRAIADGDASGDANLSAHHAIVSDLDVVTNQHVIIDLGSGADARGSQRSAVDRAEGPNLDIFAYLHNRQRVNLMQSVAVAFTAGRSAA